MTEQPPEQRDAVNTTDPRQGLVIGTAPGLFWVFAGGERVLCGLRGNLRKAGKPARQHQRAVRQAQRRGALPAGRDEGAARRQVREDRCRKFKQFLALKNV